MLPHQSKQRTLFIRKISPKIFQIHLIFDMVMSVSVSSLIPQQFMTTKILNLEILLMVQMISMQELMQCHMNMATHILVLHSGKNPPPIVGN